jgi:hypothetical protein
MIALILMWANHVADWLALRFCQRPAGTRRNTNGLCAANRPM